MTDKLLPRPEQIIPRGAKRRRSKALSAKYWCVFVCVCINVCAGVRVHSCVCG